MSVGLKKTRLSLARQQFRRSGDWLRVRLCPGIALRRVSKRTLSETGR